MIFPFLKGIPYYASAPFTWTLVYLNVLLFSAGYIAQNSVEQELEEMWKNDQFVETTGMVFSQYLSEFPERSQKMHGAVNQMVLNGNLTRARVLANMSFRHQDFLVNGERFFPQGDEVALADWKSQFVKFRETQFSHPSYIWGLSARSNGWMNYITYQFAHGSIFHLLGNMFFLLVFGAFIELSFGSLVFLLIYFISGVFAASVFDVFSGVGYSPLIGASGSISGLMAFIGVTYRRRNITCAYFILPVQNYFGIIYLPGWTILLFWLVSDLAGALGTVSEFGGVAHSAHLGGAAMGALMAFGMEMGRVEAPSAIT